MAPMLRKRPAAPPSAAAQHKKRSSKQKQPAPPVPKKPTKRKPRPSKNAVPVPEPHFAGFQGPPYRPVTNPQATLQGLPAELRIEIYKYLSDTTLVHVHRHLKPGTRRFIFTWTPCKGANPRHPVLCANPKWSGLCTEEDRCTYKIAAPPEPRGFYGLAATCKAMRHDTQEFFQRHTVFSIKNDNLGLWLAHLRKHAYGQLLNIRRLTVISTLPGTHVDNRTAGILREFPNLEAVGVQQVEPLFRYVHNIAAMDVDVARTWKAWGRWFSLRELSPRISLTMEGTVYVHRRNVKVRENGGVRVQPIKEEQFVTRIIREGKEEGYVGEGWDDEDVKFELVRPGGLVAPRRDAQWRLWWPSKEFKNYT